MTLAAMPTREQDRALSAVIVARAILLVSLCALLGIISAITQAQTYTQGLPAVGNNNVPSTASPSKMLIDATLFPDTDMCASIADACAKLGKPNYPNGGTIDARGFTGDQVCAANNATQMLNGCTANGGKLLLGTVHLYADGPTGGINGHFDDGHGSGVGTPAFIIPDKFWGIEGVSRGSGESAVGTFLSVCMGPNNPIGGTNPCHKSFPVRSFVVNFATVVGNTMTMTVSPAANWGVNIYAGELVMMKGNMIVPGENGTYKVQNNSPDTTVAVTVPNGTLPGTPPVGSNCGTLYLGTPILGFGPPGGAPYGTASNACGGNLCSSFGGHIRTVGFNCQGADSSVGGPLIAGIQGCIGWQNLYAEEGSGVESSVVDNYSFVGFDTHGAAAQNFGPVLNMEVYTGTVNANCDFGTTGGYIGDAQMRGLDGWTINQSSQSPNPATNLCLNTPITAVLLDAPSTEVRNGHCERTANCVLIGANNSPGGTASGQLVSGVSGGDVCAALPPATCSVVQISSNSPAHGKPVVERIQQNNYTNAVLDSLNNVTLGHMALNDGFMALYSYAGIRGGAIATGVSTPTDLAGQCIVQSGAAHACPTIPFTQSYSNPPICTCSDATSNASCHVTVSPTTLIVAGGAASDQLDYICIGRN
jgi:hypothetical protein